MKVRATLLVVLCMLIAAPFVIQPQGLYQNDNVKQVNSWTVGYTERSPIVINHDDNFTALGFSGDGSETTPYVIDDLNITSDLIGITISNTRAYFEITNCYFAPESDVYSIGIGLENVTNAYVGLNTFSNKATAIQWNNVNYSKCFNNQIWGNQDNGIFISSSYNCGVNQNHIHGNDDHQGSGILLHYSYYCDIYENEVTSSFSGIKAEYSEYCTVNQNILQDFNSGSLAAMGYPSAVEISNSPNCSVTQNKIDDSPVSGILLMSPSSIVLSDNVLTGCGLFPQNLMPGNPGFSTTNDLVNDKPVLYVWNQTGIIIDGSLYGQAILHEAKFCSIDNGAFDEASVGIFLSFSTNCTVENTNASRNHFAGAFMYFSNNCTFDEMVLEDNSRMVSAAYFSGGVWVFGCQNARVTNCEISDSEGAGLLVIASPTTLISDNVFLKNGIFAGGMGLPAATDYYFVEKNNVVNGKQFGYFYNESDMTLDGTLYGQILVVNSSNVNIVGGDYSDATCGASFILSNNCSLKDAIMKQNSFYGLQILSSTNTSIIGSTIDDNPYLSIYNPYSVSTKYLNNSICKNGHEIPENQVSPIMVVRPFDYLYNNKISNNRVGILLEGQNITLYKNNITCNGLLGIMAVNSDYFNITKNIISGAFYEIPSGSGIPDPTLSGIYISSSTGGVIRNNSVYSNSGYGIAIGSLSAQNIEVYWNEIGWNGRGNAIDGGTANLWDDDDATGNAWSDYVGTGTYPIPLSSSIDRYPSTLTDGTTPTVNSPDDEVFEAGTLGNEIVWQASDNYPGRFVVYQNGTVITNRTWCFDPIEVELDPLAVGTHNLTIVVYDGAGNHVSDMVLVDAVDTIGPTIDSPEDIEYVVGETGNNIIWHGSDLNPASYEVFIDDVSIETGDWASSADPIIVGIDGLTAGEYNYTIVLTDQGSNTVSDCVIVTVTEPPTTPTTTTTTTPTDGVIPTMTIWIALGAIGVVVLLVIVVIRIKR